MECFSLLSPGQLPFTDSSLLQSLAFSRFSAFSPPWLSFSKSCQFHYFVLLIIFFLLFLGGTSVLITFLFSLEFLRFLYFQSLKVNSINKSVIV